MSRRGVLVVTTEPIGRHMAGPAIRAVELGAVLARRHDVRVESTAGGRAEAGTLHRAAQQADVLVVSGDVLARDQVLAAVANHVVVDLYDPVHLEQLEQSRDLAPPERADQVSGAVRALSAMMRVGDFFLCANETQRALWLGHLAAVGRLNPSTYDDDPSLRRLIDVVGFGLPPDPPLGADPVLRGVDPRVPADAEIILWGGGMYNWLDPLTVIRAVGELAARRPLLRLVILAGPHPNPGVPTSAVAVAAEQEARRLGLLDRHVVLWREWIPYQDRGNLLVECDIGVTAHGRHVETTFSHRTRVLDYLWAGLPVVTSEGDEMARLVDAAGAGVVVRTDDVAGMVAALEGLLSDRQLALRASRSAATLAAGLRWDQMAAPLAAFCEEPWRAADLRGPARRHAAAAARRAMKPGVVDRAAAMTQRVREEGAGPLRRALARRIRRG